jgi:signal peptidase I
MAEKPARHGHLGNVLWAVGAALALSVMVLVAQSALPPGTALVKPIQVSDAAMLPTLTRGQIVLVTKRIGNPQRWELVVYSPREGAVEPGRVIGLPGEVIQVHGGTLTVDGLIADEPYVREPIQYELGPVKVDPGSYFILSDNRNQATDDSHVVGAISLANILARVTPLG